MDILGMKSCRFSHFQTFAIAHRVFLKHVSSGQLCIYRYAHTVGHRHMHAYVHFSTLGYKMIHCSELKPASVHYIRKVKSVHIHSKTCGSPKWCALTENEGFTQAQQKSF